MTPESFTIRLNELGDWMRSQLTRDIIVAAAFKLSADINHRVEMTGKNSNGDFFSPYSEAYLKYRKKNKANKFKNFSDRRVMWGNFGVKKTDENQAVIGGKTAEAQKLIDLNSSREQDNIIQPNEKEIKQIAEYINKKIAEKIKTTLR